MALDKPQAVLFDLDGTLVDSAPDLTTAVNRMLVDLQRPVIAEAQVRDWIGNGARRLVARALAGQHVIDVEPAETDAAMERFFVHYTDCLCDQSVCYPGVVRGLTELQAMGLPLGIVTNKPSAFTGPLLEAMELAAFFPVTVSGDTLAVKKPDPAPLIYAAEQLGVDIRQCLYVGDSQADWQASHAAGSTLVRVPHGYPGKADVFADHPDTLTWTVAELAEQLRAAA